jgi:probable rRNA maturation factor
MHELRLTLQAHDRFEGLPARGTLRRWMRSALDRNAELTLRFVDAGEGRRLNRQFRGRDYATDVLTFSYARGPTARADIVICPPVVRRAARALGRLPRAHYAHLLVHATLHALGHDHVTREGTRRMEAREIAVLRELGYGNPYQSSHGQ